MRFGNFIYRLLDNIILSIIVVFALYKGRATPFYLLYLFLWEELIRQLVYFILGRFKQKSGISIKELFPGIVIGLVYFLIVSFFFLWLFNGGNPEFEKINREILYFKNPFFLLSLGLFTVLLVIHSLFNHKNVSFEKELSPMSRRYFVLYLALIMGLVIWGVMQIFGAGEGLDPFMCVLLPSIPFLVLRATVNTGFEFPKRNYF